MLRLLLAVLLLILLQLGACTLRQLCFGFGLQHALAGAIGTLTALALLADARHRFPLGKSWLLAAVPAALGPMMGLWGLAAILFWVLVYVMDLRHRGRPPSSEAIRCPRCKGLRVEVISKPEHYCPDCGFSFDRFE